MLWLLVGLEKLFPIRILPCTKQFFLFLLKFVFTLIKYAVAADFSTLCLRLSSGRGYWQTTEKKFLAERIGRLVVTKGWISPVRQRTGFCSTCWGFLVLLDRSLCLSGLAHVDIILLTPLTLEMLCCFQYFEIMWRSWGQSSGELRSFVNLSVIIVISQIDAFAGGNTCSVCQPNHTAATACYWN